MKARIVFAWFILLSIGFWTGCEKTVLEEEPVTGNPDPGDGNGVDPGENEGENGELSLYQVAGDQITLNLDYSVGPDLRPFQEDKGKHRQMWGAVTSLLPSQNRSPIDKFEVFHGGGSLLGYVYNTDASLDNWVFGLDIYSAFPNGVLNDDGEFVYTLIHEYGHILTLNSSQLAPGTSSEACSSYHVGEGCSRENSYIGPFWQRFWSDIWSETQNGEAYDLYPDRFVSSYAGTNPAEDIAETFTAFVLRTDPRPASRVSDQKVAFLWDYPELVELRSYIRAQSSYMPSSSAKRLSQSIFTNRGHSCLDYLK